MPAAQPQPDSAEAEADGNAAAPAPGAARRRKGAKPPHAQASPKPARSAPQRALDQMGLLRDIDLALHLPLRYEDETRITPIADCHDGEPCQVEGTVLACRIEFRPRRQLVVRLADAAGDELVLRFLNFYPSHQKALAEGSSVRVRGEPRGGFFGREMVHPQFKAVQPGAPLAAALTPVYPTRAQLPQAYLRKVVAAGLARAPLDEVLPEGVVPAGLPPLREALTLLHHPAPEADAEALLDHDHPARQRLVFEELLAQQLSQLRAQAQRARLQAPALVRRPGALHDRLLATLPFALTEAQRRVNDEITADLARPQPMHRLLQGDVGAGKTVVAALAASVTLDAGWQCTLMAPTEILAEQHFAKLVQWLQPLGVQVAWLTGRRKGRARQVLLDRIASGEIGLVIGTHAVIQDDVHFARLGLAIVDEQHRFGVLQRLALRRKRPDDATRADVADPAAAPVPGRPAPPALEPHLLMMSATPIPRTLAMTYFADLAVSTIDTLPPGRTPVLTKLFADSRRGEVIARIADEVAQGRQVYWVCPLIEDSEAGAEGAAAAAGAAGHRRGRNGQASGGGDRPELQNVIETHQRLAAALPGCNVALLHGRLPPAEKSEVMGRFDRGEIAVLVATTVIEVGVDVPNASLMVIEHAERFGLSQLHQLRGRVGRGAAASVCVLLFATPLSPTGKERLRAMAETQDGFEIARRDLEIRGPGEFMGARQSGDALLRFADLTEDSVLLARARQVAPALLKSAPQAAQAHVSRWLGARAEYLKA